MNNLEKVQELHRRLGCLLNDSEVGCFSWHMMYQEVLNELSGMVGRNPMATYDENVLCDASNYECEEYYHVPTN